MRKLGFGGLTVQSHRRRSRPASPQLRPRRRGKETLWGSGFLLQEREQTAYTTTFADVLLERGTIASVPSQSRWHEVSIVKQGSTEERQPIFRLPTTIPSKIQSRTLQLKNVLRSDPNDLTNRFRRKVQQNGRTLKRVATT